MKFPAGLRAARGLTLVEVLVVLTLVGVLLALAAPSFKRMIDLQRLRGINGNLLTDLQLARSEAASRNVRVFVNFDNSEGSPTCYVVLTGDRKDCDCKKQPGIDVCGTLAREIRTVQVERSLGVTVALPSSQSARALGFEPATGRLIAVISDIPKEAVEPFLVDTTLANVGALRNALEVTGRPTTCSPSGQISGVPTCTTP